MDAPGVTVGPPEDKLGILEENEVDWDGLPSWRRRGAGIHWSDTNEEGDGPALVIDANLPEADAYRELLKRFLI